MPRSLLAVVVLAGCALPCPADSKPVKPFDGATLNGWKLKADRKTSHWSAAHVRVNPDKPTELADAAKDVPTGTPTALVNMKGLGVDIYTEQQFGDCTVELEFMVPKGSNSGVYLMGEYEVQVFDSYGRDTPGRGDAGAIYDTAAPKVNAARKPGEWQKLVIDFRAPKFDGTRKTANARFLKVTLNDQVVNEDVAVNGPTPGGLTGKEVPTGPLMLQGDHGPVAYRNIVITPK